MFKNFKNKISYLLVGLLVGCLFPIQSVFAEQPITLIINGKTITNASPQIVSDRMYVPLRVISEELGATVEWDGVNRVVIVNNRVNNNQNQNNTQTTHEKPYIKNGLEYITINNINYISLSSIINLNYDKGYSFEYDSNSKTAIFVYNSYFGHPIDKNEILLNNIKIKNIQDKSYIEYDYYIENILPLIK